MKTFWASAIACTALFTGTITESVSAIGIITTLYDGNGLPANQGYLQMTAIDDAGNVSPALDGEGNVIFSFNGESSSGGNVTVDTTSNSAAYAGYSNYNLSTGNYLSTFDASTLNRNDGYRITFTVSLSGASSHNSTSTSDRAPFSIIAISSNDKQGIEIGFRVDEIFSQSSNFGALSESSSTSSITVNPTSLATYILTVYRDKYLLNFSDNLETPIIQGDLKQYDFAPISSSPSLPNSFNPYQTESFIFLGDTTSEASGTFTLGKVDLDLTPVPFEFSPTYGLLALGGIAAVKHWRDKQKK